MIVKMNFLSITGPKDDIERMAGQYLSRYEIQLENALTELKTVRNLRAYTDKNPYEEILRQAREYFPEDLNTDTEYPDMTLERAREILTEAEERISVLQKEREELEQERERCRRSVDSIFPFKELDYSVHDLLEFKYVKYRFGRISREYFEKFERYVYDSLDTIFYVCQQDEEYVSGVYFVPVSLADQVDAVYASMHFEHIYVPDEYEGTGKEAYESRKRELDRLEGELAGLDEKIRAITEGSPEPAAALKYLEKCSESFDIRKYAALTRERNNVFYILCGWMSQEDADAFQKELEKDEQTFVVVEEDHDNVFSTPPTKLKNKKLFRPFELYVRMYGLPAYNEMDPTMFIALSYSFIFGAMFGDVGQGLLLLIGGFLLYKKKGMDLAAIVSCAGFFSTIFGFLYGSFFGFEDTVIHHIWLQPNEAMVNLPVIGQIKTVFVVAVVFGMFLILTAMVMHICVCLHSHEAGEALFDTNGVAGFIFYGVLAAVLILVMSGHALPAGIILAVVLGIPLLAMAFKEPLSSALEKRGKGIEGGMGMYLVQTFFEMFEVLLSFFSNTLSFVRVGAFAVSHAAMMEVVLMLAGFENGGGGNWIVIVFGNLFVCAMEGLIVGIQVLRLEYYELFSRYYKGSGREFKPYRIKQ